MIKMKLIWNTNLTHIGNARMHFFAYVEHNCRSKLTTYICLLRIYKESVAVTVVVQFVMIYVHFIMTARVPLL